MNANYQSITAGHDHDGVAIDPDIGFFQRSSEQTTNLIGQYFSDAFSDELQLRGLARGRTVMRAVSSTEILEPTYRRTRVELNVITEVPGATHNDLIDVLLSAKRRCSAKIGFGVKILLRAELRSGTLDTELLPYSAAT